MHVVGTSLLILPALSPLRAPVPLCSDAAPTPWGSFAKFNVDVAWQGTATVIDPNTCEPTLPPVTYDHFVSAEPKKPGAIRTTTTTTSGSGAGGKAEEVVVLEPSTFDVDLDGSFSTEHAEGLGLAEQLFAATGKERAVDAPHLVIEHSLAVSDDERRRCLLSYAGGALERVLLLVERRLSADAVDPAPPATLYSLLGVWNGDACVRSLLPPAAEPRGRAPARGFGAPPSRGSARRALAKAVGGTTSKTNVFKARLTYAWDGEELLQRQLQVTSFDGSELDAIRSVGTLRRHSGEWGEYESVDFVGDSSAPTLLLLPSSCHVLAPLQLPEDGAAFSTEFGAVLEAGESFGWQGFRGVLPGVEEGQEEEGGDDDDDAQRLVRIGRLYNEGAFVSGTTSLCSTE